MKKTTVNRIFKIFLTVALILTFLPACDCITSVEDLTPDISEFCQWDGNYIYRGNMKVKTSGEDAKVLFDSVEFNGVIYDFETIIQSKYYLFADNNTLILSTPVREHIDKPSSNPPSSDKLNDDSFSDQSSSDSEPENEVSEQLEVEESQPKSMIIKYLIKEKTYEILHVSYKYDFYYYSIVKYDPDLGIIVIANGWEFVFIHYLEGEEFEPLDGIETFYTHMYNDYVFLVGKTAVYYGHYSQKEFTFLRNNTTGDKFNIMVEPLNINGIDLVFTAEGSYRLFYSSAMFLNPKTNKTYTVDLLTGEKTFKILRNDIIIVGDPAKYYHNNDYLETFIENPFLYKITIENDNIKCSELTKLPDDTLFGKNTEMGNGTIGFTLAKRSSLSKKPNYNLHARPVWHYYVFNPNTNRFISVPGLEGMRVSPKREPIIVNCGNLSYYIESDRTNYLWVNTNVYYLRSKNISTGEIFLNYFYTDDGQSNLGKRPLLFYDLTELSKCLILPY